MSEERLGASGEIDWEAAYSGDLPDTPVDRDVVRVAGELHPGTALDLGCGSGQNSIWLGARGWRVHALTVARDPVAPGGTLLIADFDDSLADSGSMAPDHLVSLGELTEALPGFELDEAEVRVIEHSHASEANDLPVVIVVARHQGPLSEEV